VCPSTNSQYTFLSAQPITLQLLDDHAAEKSKIVKYVIVYPNKQASEMEMGQWVMGRMGHHFWMGHVGHGSQPLTHDEITQYQATYFCFPLRLDWPLFSVLCS